MGIFSWIIKRNKRPDKEGLSPTVVVADFGECLEVRAPVPGTVADVSELPYPKKEIKIAILLLLKATNDPELKEHLKFAYVSLADWQAGVGPTHQGLDITKRDDSKRSLEQAKEVAVRGREMEEWQSIVNDEQNALIAELKHYGFW